MVWGKFWEGFGKVLGRFWAGLGSNLKAFGAGRFSGALGALLEQSWVLLGPFKAVLGRFGRLLRPI